MNALPLRSWIAGSLVTLAVAGGTARSDEPVDAKTIRAEPIQSIYNDELRCFRFRIEGAEFSIESAYAFARRYESSDHPEILGAFPDADEADVLCIVGPPEAEQAIRTTLAMFQIDSVGLAGASLKLRKRELASNQRTLIEEIGLLEVELAGIESNDTEAEGKRRAIAERVEAFEGELAIIERQLAVVARAMERLAEATADE